MVIQKNKYKRRKSDMKIYHKILLILVSLMTLSFTCIQIAKEGKNNKLVKLETRQDSLIRDHIEFKADMKNDVSTILDSVNEINIYLRNNH